MMGAGGGRTCPQKREEPGRGGRNGVRRRALGASIALWATTFTGLAAATALDGTAADRALVVEDRACRSVALADEIDGPAVIHLWATWCAPCLEELPELAAFLAARPDLARHILVLSVDSRPTERVAAWLDEHGLSDLPLRRVVEGNAGAHFGVTGYPATVWLSGNGEIVARDAGRLAWSSPGLIERLVAHIGG